jgi:hypothetical protein
MESYLGCLGPSCALPDQIFIGSRLTKDGQIDILDFHCTFFFESLFCFFLLSATFFWILALLFVVPLLLVSISSISEEEQVDHLEEWPTLSYGRHSGCENSLISAQLQNL